VDFSSTWETLYRCLAERGGLAMVDGSGNDGSGGSGGGGGGGNSGGDGTRLSRDSRVRGGSGGGGGHCGSSSSLFSDCTRVSVASATFRDLTTVAIDRPHHRLTRQSVYSYTLYDVCKLRCRDCNSICTTDHRDRLRLFNIAGLYRSLYATTKLATLSNGDVSGAKTIQRFTTSQ